jgi:hypothetical protein
MLRLIADENLNGGIVRGLSSKPDIDLVRVQDVGLAGATDADVLSWAAEHDRIVLTHDRATMPRFAYDRVTAGRDMTGVFITDDRGSIGEAIASIDLVARCSEQPEWSGLVVYLPL